MKIVHQKADQGIYLSLFHLIILSFIFPILSSLVSSPCDLSVLLSKIINSRVSSSHMLLCLSHRVTFLRLFQLILGGTADT